MALFFHSIASLVTAECACASLIFTSFIEVPSLVCVGCQSLLHSALYHLQSSRSLMDAEVFKLSAPSLLGTYQTALVDIRLHVVRVCIEMNLAKKNELWNVH